MREELIVKKTASKCLNITASKIDSLRINTDTATTVRVYDDGKIGVAGKIGKCDIDELRAEAKANLANGIAYPDIPNPECKREERTKVNILSSEEFVPTMRKLLQRLSDENPSFSFSNKITLNEIETSYKSGETEYLYTGNSLEISLCIKYKGSSNIMDEQFGCATNEYNEEEIAHGVKTVCDAFLKKATLPKEDEAVFVVDEYVASMILNNFVADYYFNHLSLFDGKLGEKIFNDKCTIFLNKSKDNLSVPFFDAEGVTTADDKVYIVKEGVFENSLANKKQADQYGISAPGVAGATYDSVPTLSAPGFSVCRTVENISDIVGDQPVIYISMTSGGDVTADGTISLPVQAAYVMRNGELTGKLPAFAVTGNVKEIFGENFLGASAYCAYKVPFTSYIVFKAKIVNREE